MKKENDALDGAAKGALYTDGSTSSFEYGNINKIKSRSFKIVRAVDFTGKKTDFTHRNTRNFKPMNRNIISRRLRGRKLVSAAGAGKSFNAYLNRGSKNLANTAKKKENGDNKTTLSNGVLYVKNEDKETFKQKASEKAYGYTYVSENDKDTTAQFTDTTNDQGISNTKKKDKQLTDEEYKILIAAAASEKDRTKERSSKKNAVATKGKKQGEKYQGKEKVRLSENNGNSADDEKRASFEYKDETVVDENKDSDKGIVSGGSVINIFTSKLTKSDPDDTTNNIFTKPSRTIGAVTKPFTTAINKLAGNDDNAGSKMVKAPARAVGTVKTFAKIAKIVAAVIHFVASIVSFLMPILLIIILIVGLVMGILSFVSMITLKSDDEELSKTYLYITELDTDFTIDLLKEKKGADEYHFYINGTYASENSLQIQTNTTSLIAYLDTKYQDYALDKFIYGLFGGENVKDEIKEIHKQLYSYDVKEYTKSEVTGTDSKGDDITKSVKHKSININIEFFDTWLFNNKDTVLPDSQYEQYELLQSYGVFLNRKELASPFPESVLQISKRYGYYNENTDKKKEDGLELVANKGDSVFAAFGGTVSYSENDVITIEANKKKVTYKNIENCLPTGTEIKKGDKLGTVGSKTNSSGSFIGIYYEKDGKEMCPFIFLEGCDNDYYASFGNQSIVDVALSQLGQIGGQPYWSWYGFGGRVEWCACFVSWCADQCGYLDSGIFVKHSSCNAGVTAWKRRGQFQYRSSSYIPKAGDIVYFDWGYGNPPDHVGIVQSCDGTTVYTIEGNSGDAVRQNTYNIHDDRLYGYATPSYPAMDDASSNAKKIWSFFKTKGCNSYAIAGIMGNLYQESKLDPTMAQGGGGPGRGLAQWEKGSDRYNNLLAFAAKRGTSWQDLNTQLEFIWHELNGGEATTVYKLNKYYGGISGFKKATSVDWATEAFEDAYERAGAPAMADRKKYAHQFYNMFAKF